MELIQLKVDLLFYFQTNKMFRNPMEKVQVILISFFTLCSYKHTERKVQEIYHISVALLQVGEVSTHFGK